MCIICTYSQETSMIIIVITKAAFSLTEDKSDIAEQDIAIEIPLINQHDIQKCSIDEIEIDEVIQEIRKIKILH